MKDQSKVNILNIIPNNLYLNASKVRKIEKAYQSNKSSLLPPILIGEINGELSLIDGHSRAWVAYNNGITELEAIVKPISEIPGPEALYRKIHKIAKERNITDISKLSDFILSNDEHNEKWVGFCKQLIDEINQ